MTHTSVLSHRRAARWRNRASPVVPRLEWLEGRCLPTSFIVTSAADSGPGTLRNTVAAAHNGDTIGFDPSLVGKTIALTSGAITIKASLAITGPGVTVSGSNLDRVFNVNGGLTVGLTGLTITGGSVVGGNGGGILNDSSNLTLTDCTVIGNTAVDIANDQGLMGGGIVSGAQMGSLDIEACLIANNSVSGPGGGAGGGVAFSNTFGTLTIHDSTFTGNSAPSQGGGLFSATGTVDIRDSTFSDNMAPNGVGGGIDSIDFKENITGSTIAFNSAMSDAGIMAPGNLVLDSTIVADNTSSNGSGDLSSSIQSNGHNLIGKPDMGFSPSPTDIVGQDPLLGPLQNNGGPTATRALLAGSPALGKGDPALAGTADQRGTVRPAAPDIGAFEAAPAVAFQLGLGTAFLPVRAGDPLSVAVVAVDAQGNIASTYTGTVHFSSDDPQASLPADFTYAPGDGGRRLLTGLVFRTAGLRTFTASTVPGDPIPFQNSRTLFVLPGPAAAFTLSGLASPVVAGQPASLTVTARDQFGNVVTDYAGTVHFSSTDPAAVLPPDFTFTSADAGAHTFPLTLSTPGPQTVTVTDVSAGITASASTTVQALSLLLSGPTQVLAGQPLVLTVTTSPAGAVVNGLTIHWGDGTQDTFATLPPTVTHVYPRGPNYVGVTVTANTALVSGPFNVVVLVPQVGTFGTGTAGPSQNVLTAAVPGTPGIVAKLTAQPPHGDVRILVALYAANPTPVPLPNAIFYDVVVNGAGPNDALELVFVFPPGQAFANLVFFDPVTGAFEPVQGGGPDGQVHTDLTAGTITVTLDRSSVPTLLSLAGTVFAVVLPGADAAGAGFSSSSPSLVNATLVSQLAASAASGLGAGLSQSAAFQAGSGLSVSLSPSTNNRQLATQSTANGGGDEVSSEDDSSPWWRMFRDLFASPAPAAEPPVALAAAPTEALSSGELDELFAEAGSDGASEIEFPVREWADVPPPAEAPGDEGDAGLAGGG
jgi:hypothetical protein